MFIVLNNTVKEIDITNPLHHSWFNSMFGDLSHIPITNGVQVFEHKGQTIIVGESIIDVATEVEQQNQYYLSR